MDGVVNYPFPLRPNLVVQLRLPLNLTREEVDRIAAFLQMLARASEVQEASDA